MKGDRLLIVDDVPKNIQVLANILVQENYEIEYATNGADALNWIKNELFDLVLLDVMMPEMDGFAVCKEIKETLETKHLPVIFITAKNDIESITRGFMSGGVDFISKPFNENELLVRVKTHLDLKKHKDELEYLVSLRTEQLQQANKELEILEIAKNEFLSMINHEIRTPLNGMKGFLELLKINIDSEELLEYLDHLELSARRLEDFSMKALLITSLRTKSYPLEMEEVNLQKNILDAIHHFAPKTAERGITIHTEFPDEHVRIKADLKLLKTCMEEIFTNILIHSVQVNNVLLRVTESKTGIDFEIRDNGSGFSEKALLNIFKPFSYGQKHVNQKIGLGLHIVKLIMTVHNAKVSAGNHEQGGASIRLKFMKHYM